MTFFFCGSDAISDCIFTFRWSLLVIGYQKETGLYRVFQKGGGAIRAIAYDEKGS